MSLLVNLIGTYIHIKPKPNNVYKYLVRILSYLFPACQRTLYRSSVSDLNQKTEDVFLQTKRITKV